MKKSSLAHKGLRILRFCIMPWKGEREPSNQILSGKTDWSGSKHLRNTETWTELMVSQWNSSGISSQDSIRCSSVKKSKSYCQYWAFKRNFHRTDHLHGDLKTMEKNANQVLNSFLSMRRDLEQDNGHSSDLDQKRSGILLTTKDQKENGTELQSKWC